MRLVTVDEVLERAFTNTENFDQALIKDFIIEATQLRHILPVLGGDLWDEMEAEFDAAGDKTGLSATNLVLFNKLITPMAFFVKYEIVTDISINQTSAGLQVINTEFSTAATNEQRGTLRETALTHAQVHLKEFLRFLEDADNIGDYPLYLASVRNNRGVKKRGGFVFPRGKKRRRDVNRPFFTQREIGNL